MNRIELSAEDLAEASRLLATMPIYKGSHRGQSANEVGVLGEIVARNQVALLGVELEPVFTTSHDFKLKNGKRVEVKTKDRTVPPLESYECSVPLYNHDHQDVAYYIFVSLQRDKNSPHTDLQRFKYAYVVGVANQKMMSKFGMTRKANEVDLSNGTKFWTDCQNIYIRDLVTLEIATDFWKDAGA